MTTLITGGSKCGKSRYAERILDNYLGNKLYIATMKPYGKEAYIAIERHRKMRDGKGFVTVEKYTDIHEIPLTDNCAVILECIGNLCANEMFCDNKIIDPTEKIVNGVYRLSCIAKKMVIVTNQVGSDGIYYSEGTAKYIHILGEINQRISEFSDNVIECVYGIPILQKGVLL
ncbi:MAG: bifunctional adenosylcobinamide kinase/adenosylcobinamide-phosphate guanylyltransferase [Ruminococcus sp.]|nr:bifunctional adenosylcobinamide kinase/adenosylcobinamide-phosphate guanylyltransferase [Ruminococcus sp.]